MSSIPHVHLVVNPPTRILLFHEKINHYTCDKQVLWESAGAFFRATTLSFQVATRTVQAFVV